MTSKVTAENEWAGRQLRALRKKAKLTQAQLAQAAGIGRELYVGLETGRRKITMTNAERLAAPLKLRDPRRLLPPPAPADPVEDSPLDRLAAAEDEVAKLRQEHDAFVREASESRAALETRIQALATQQSERRSSARKK